MFPASYTFSANYATGGEVCDPAATWPGVCRSPVIVHPLPAAGYTFSWQPSGKIIAYQNGAEVAPGTNLQTLISAPVVMIIISRLRAR